MDELAQEPPSRTDGCGTFAVASWNIRSGRNAGLESALRAMASCGVDLGILQETKLTKNIYTRSSAGYTVVATEAVSASQGGVALFWRESDFFEVDCLMWRGVGNPAGDQTRTQHLHAVVRQV